MQIQPDNAETAFKCAHCGHMFSREGRKEAACPQCGFVCSEATCATTGASNAGY